MGMCHLRPVVSLVAITEDYGTAGFEWVLYSLSWRWHKLRLEVSHDVTPLSARGQKIRTAAGMLRDPSAWCQGWRWELETVYSLRKSCSKYLGQCVPWNLLAGSGKYGWLFVQTRCSLHKIRWLSSSDPNWSRPAVFKQCAWNPRWLQKCMWSDLREKGRDQVGGNVANLQPQFPGKETSSPVSFIAVARMALLKKKKKKFLLLKNHLTTNDILQKITSYLYHQTDLRPIA